MDSQLPFFNVANCVQARVLLLFQEGCFLLCIYIHLGNGISKAENGVPLGAKYWSKSLSSPIILEFSLSKLLASFQELCLYQPVTREWQMKYLGGVLGEFHLFGYFLSPLSHKTSKPMNADVLLSWAHLKAEPYTFKVNR